MPYRLLRIEQQSLRVTPDGELLGHIRVSDQNAKSLSAAHQANLIGVAAVVDEVVAIEESQEPRVSRIAGTASIFQSNASRRITRLVAPALMQSADAMMAPQYGSTSARIRRRACSELTTISARGWMWPLASCRGATDRQPTVIPNRPHASASAHANQRRQRPFFGSLPVDTWFTIRFLF